MEERTINTKMATTRRTAKRRRLKTNKSKIFAVHGIDFEYFLLFKSQRFRGDGQAARQDCSFD